MQWLHEGRRNGPFPSSPTVLPVQSTACLLSIAALGGNQGQGRVRAGCPSYPERICLPGSFTVDIRFSRRGYLITPRRRPRI